MPWNIQVLYVYYRPSIFKEAGITETPKTYDEFLEDIKKCTMVQMVMERQTYTDLVCVVLPVDRSHGEVSSMVKVEALMI